MSEKVTALHKGLRVLKALRGHTLDGLSNQQLSQATGYNPTAISRITQALIEEGLAEKRADGRYSLSIKMLQIAQSHALEMQAAQDRLNEINSRVAAGSHQ